MIDAYLVNLKKMHSALCYPGIRNCTRDDGTNRKTTEEGPDLQKQPSKKNRGS